MFELQFRLIDAWDNYKYFDSIEEAQQWIAGIGEEMFNYVDLLMGEDLLEGFTEIMEYRP